MCIVIMLRQTVCSASTIPSVSSLSVTLLFSSFCLLITLPLSFYQSVLLSYCNFPYFTSLLLSIFIADLNKLIILVLSSGTVLH